MARRRAIAAILPVVAKLQNLELYLFVTDLEPMSDPNATPENLNPASDSPASSSPAPEPASPAEATEAAATAGGGSITPGSTPVSAPAQSRVAPLAGRISPGSAPAAPTSAPAPSSSVSETTPTAASETGEPKTKPPIRLTWGRPELLEPETAEASAPSGPRPAPGSGQEARRRVGRPLPLGGSQPERPRDRDREEDASVDEELARVMAQAPAPIPEKPLKRQWDEDLEAELSAAMEGFDGGSISTGAPRKPAAARTAGSSRDRGQEEGGSGAKTGKVVSVRGKSIFVDLGGKSEGVLDIDQLEGQPLPEVGSTIEVLVDHYDRDEGILILRRKGAAVEADWTNLKKGLIVEAKVTKVNKGGLDVEVDGIRGFLPISQIELGRVEDTTVYLNQKFKVVVTEANQREKNLVVSRRDLLEQERAEMREKTWASLAEGQIREGVVRSIREFGAFVDLGGVDGLLPIGEMSWFRVKKVEDLLKIGDTLKVQVLKIDQVAKKLSLGLRQLTASPWDTASQKYQRGTMVPGKVTRIMDFGAFVELEPGIEGLIHVSALSPTRVRRVSDIIKPDQEVEVRILKVEPDEKRIALSLLPAPKPGALGAEPEVEEEEADDTPAAPKPERKVPLKGGLGGGGGNLFG